MSTTIVYDNNGSVAITTICNNMTAREYVQKFLPARTRYFTLSDSGKLPSDIVFRDAWIFTDRKILVNIDKAKSIKREQFRKARKPLLEQLDIKYMRAVETSNTAAKKAIAAKKEQLRDVTDIELPDEIDELSSFWPDVLN